MNLIDDCGVNVLKKMCSLFIFATNNSSSLHQLSHHNKQSTLHPITTPHHHQTHQQLADKNLLCQLTPYHPKVRPPNRSSLQQSCRTTHLPPLHGSHGPHQKRPHPRRRRRNVHRLQCRKPSCRTRRCPWTSHHEDRVRCS